MTRSGVTGAEHAAALSTPHSGSYAAGVNPIHFFTFRGIPVFVSPMYLLLLLMFGYRDPLQGVLWAIAITISLLVHEFGHALVASRLRHDPVVTLQGLGGVTSRRRTGRDVDEAAIVAMGPAAGLALGLLVFGVWQVLLHFRLVTPVTVMIVRALLYPCIVWNLLNLLPLWPLDGGHLLKLGVGRWASSATTARITHGLSLLMVALLSVYALQHRMIFSLVILLMLGVQNYQAFASRGAADDAAGGDRGARGGRANPLALELIDNAHTALERGDNKEAARLAHQARAQDGVTPAAMEQIWEILGIATERLGEDEEALAYLKRARPNELVREATLRILTRLGRSDELDEFRKRWSITASAPGMNRWLTGALAFIVFSLIVVFQTSLSDLFL